MKTNVKNSKNEVAKIKGQKSEAQKSNYKVNVIETNNALNTEKNSLGAYLDLLLKYKHLLCVEFQEYIIEVRVNDNKEKYDALKDVVRTSPKGKFNQFYTLQGLQKVCFPKKSK